VKNYTRCKDMNVVVAKLIKQGWEFTAGAHGRITHPSGKYLTFSMSPSDKYAFRQLERDVRRLLKQLGEAHENT
jgi:predicted RNA binding protein YcfA (HicA-like mRNA interferase family)